MLENITSLKPDISVITNIAEDHLDRYESFEAYKNTKLNITKYCTEKDIFIKNLDNTHTASFNPDNVTIRTISRKLSDADISFSNSSFNLPGGNTYSYTNCSLKGIHNIENILLSVSAAHEAGIDTEHIIHALSNFPPLPHRLEPVQANNRSHVYNDSKATTLQAVCSAIESFPQNIVLILGGRGKGLDFSCINKYKDRLKHVICYGEDGKRILDTLTDIGDKSFLTSFEEAVKKQWAVSSKEDVLLLSPGCTSWDQFTSYTARGEQYIRLIQSLDKQS
jgi:UDP-N-acetylmuramoylalanine--D-glutamate ligase